MTCSSCDEKIEKTSACCTTALQHAAVRQGCATALAYCYPCCHCPTTVPNVLRRSKRARCASLFAWLRLHIREPSVLQGIMQATFALSSRCTGDTSAAQRQRQLAAASVAPAPLDSCFCCLLLVLCTPGLRKLLFPSLACSKVYSAKRRSVGAARRGGRSAHTHARPNGGTGENQRRWCCRSAAAAAAAAPPPAARPSPFGTLLAA